MSKVSTYVTHMEFKHDLHYRKSLFSPVDITNGMIELQKPFIDAKQIHIHNTL